MNGPQVASHRFPYLPIQVSIGDQRTELEALLDTGFDGDLLVPETFAPDRRPDMELCWILADGSRIVAPAYRGLVRIGDFDAIRVKVSVLGDEAVVGRAIIARFDVRLDHGRDVFVVP